ARGIGLPNQSDIEHLITAENYLLAAQALRTKMGDDEYFEFLRETFDRPTVRLPEFHRLLAQIPFTAAGTTNYETLVERAAIESKQVGTIPVFSQTDYAQLGTALNSKEYFVLKAHGTIDRPETIVLSEKDYATLIHSSSGYRTFLKALFLDRTVLFLGFGLNDPELRLLLEELREIFDGNTPLHYALLDISGTTRTEQENFETHYGVRIIPYNPTTLDHPEVIEFLREILAKLPKYIIAHAMNSALKPAKEVLNSDSHYRLVMNSDNEFSVREKYDGASNDKPLTFTVGFEFDKKKETDREAHEALKKLFAEGEPATIKSPQLSKFIPPEILSPLMPNKVTEMQITFGPAKSDKTLIVRAIMEPNDGPSVTLDNIALKEIRGGSEKAVLSNEDQEVPWKLTQVINFKENQAETTFTCNCVDIPIKQALKIEKFWEALSRGGYLTIEIEKNDSRIGHSKIEAGIFEAPDPRMIQILEALEVIQRKTGVTFTSPQRVSPEKAKEILTVAQIVTTGSATMMPPEMNFTVKELQDMIPKFATGVTMAIEHYADGWVSVVLGKQLHLGPVLISCDKLHVAAGDREQVMERIAELPPEAVVNVQMSAVEGSQIQANYVAWLSQADAETFRNKPFVRTTSLNNLMNALFEAAIETNGTLNIGEFMNLLAQAKDESTNEELPLSP